MARINEGRAPSEVLAGTGNGQGAGTKAPAKYSAVAWARARHLAELVNDFYFGPDGERHQAEFEAWKAARA